MSNYIIDAMWEHYDILKNWEALSRVLLSEEDEDTIDERGQQILIEILNCCVKKASGKTICPKTKQETDKPPKAKVIQSSREDLTKQLMKLIPQLLSKYQGDIDKLIPLSEIPQYFILDLYSTQRQKTYFNEMTRYLVEFFIKHNSKELLTSVSTTISYLYSSEYALKSEFNNRYLQLIEDINENIQDSIKEEDLTKQYLYLDKLNSLFKLINLCGQIDIYEEIDSILENKSSSEVTVPAMLTMNQLILWLFASISTESFDNNAISNLSSKLKRFYSQLETFIKSKDTEEQKQAILLLLDLAIIFPHQYKDTPFDSLALSITSSTQKSISSFIRMQLNEEDLEEEWRELYINSACKSVIYDIIEPSIMLPTIVLFITEDSSLLENEYIKITLNKLRERNPKEEGKGLYLALRQLFESSKDIINDKSTQEKLKNLSVILSNLYSSSPLSKADSKQRDIISLSELVTLAMSYLKENPVVNYQFIALSFSKLGAKLDSKLASDCYEVASAVVNDLPSEEEQEDEEEEEEGKEAGGLLQLFYKFVDTVKAVGKGQKYKTSPPKKSKKSKAKKIARDLAQELDSVEDPKTKKSRKRSSVEDIQSSDQEEQEEESNKKKKSNKKKGSVAVAEQKTSSSKTKKSKGEGKKRKSRSASSDVEEEENPSPKSKSKH